MPHVATYARTSTNENQIIGSQLHGLKEVAARHGWTTVSVLTSEGISGTKGRNRRPAFDDLMKGYHWRELVAVSSLCRLGRFH